MDLKLALTIFKQNNSFDEIQLWGRVRGLYKDYYVIIGIKNQRNSPFPLKEYFWAYEDFNFAPLNEANLESFAFLSSLNGYFHGEHNKILKVSEGSNIPDFDPENIDRKYLL